MRAFVLGNGAAVGRQYADSFRHVHRAAAAQRDDARRPGILIRLHRLIDHLDRRIGQDVQEHADLDAARFDDLFDLIDHADLLKAAIRHDEHFAGAAFFEQFRQSLQRADAEHNLLRDLERKVVHSPFLHSSIRGIPG